LIDGYDADSLYSPCRGLHQGDGGIVRSVAIAGLSVALDLALTGRMVAAAEAFRLGLVNRVVTDDQLMVTAEELAKQILQNSQQAIRSAKENISGIIGRNPDLRSVSQPNIRESLQSELRTTA
jgi:enoyl-CoA hydratase/carnithine racemase